MSDFQVLDGIFHSSSILADWFLKNERGDQVLESSCLELPSWFFAHRIQRKKKTGKIPNGRRKSSYMLNYSESSTSSQYPVPGPNMGANGLIMSPMITMWMVPPAPRDNSSTLVDFHHDQQPISKWLFLASRNNVASSFFKKKIWVLTMDRLY